MDAKISINIGIIVIIIATIVLSGCTSVSKTSDSNVTPTVSVAASSIPSSGSTSDNLVPVQTSGDTITISGTGIAGKSQDSQNFELKKGVYIYSIESDTIDSNGIMVEACKAGSIDKTFGAAVYDTADNGGSYILIVDGTIIKPETYYLNEYGAGTYTMTITSRPTGDALPQTWDISNGKQVAKAIALNPGTLKMTVKADDTGYYTNYVSLYDGDGKLVNFTSKQVDLYTKEYTGEISASGVYGLNMKFSGFNATVTISQ